MWTATYVRVTARVTWDYTGRENTMRAYVPALFIHARSLAARLRLRDIPELRRVERSRHSALVACGNASAACARLSAIPVYR